MFLYDPQGSTLIDVLRRSFVSVTWPVWLFCIGRNNGGPLAISLHSPLTDTELPARRALLMGNLCSMPIWISAFATHRYFRFRQSYW